MSTANDRAEKLRQLAYENWCRRGCQHGHDVDDWVLAEQQLVSEPVTESITHDVVQEASEESFPASDPPAWSGATLSPSLPSANYDEITEQARRSQSQPATAAVLPGSPGNPPPPGELPRKAK
jgi:hypothetical protein